MECVLGISSMFSELSNIAPPFSSFALLPLTSWYLHLALHSAVVISLLYSLIVVVQSLGCV